MQLQTLQDVFIEQLKDLYSAENQLLKALPKMAKAASSPELKEAFEEHLEQTRNQVDRLDQVMEMTGATGKGKKCMGMQGLIEEGEETLGMKKQAAPAALDAAMIANAQRIEHYEIAAYGTVANYAKQLGLRDAMELLRETLDEEEQTDKRLTQISGRVNLEAAEAAPEAETGSRSSKKSGQKSRSAR